MGEYRTGAAARSGEVISELIDDGVARRRNPSGSYGSSMAHPPRPRFGSEDFSGREWPPRVPDPGISRCVRMPSECQLGGPWHSVQKVRSTSRYTELSTNVVPVASFVIVLWTAWSPRRHSRRRNRQRPSPCQGHRHRSHDRYAHWSGPPTVDRPPPPPSLASIANGSLRPNWPPNSRIPRRYALCRGPCGPRGCTVWPMSSDAQTFALSASPGSILTMRCSGRPTVHPRW